MSFGLLKDFLETTEEERVEVLYRYLVKGETGSYIAEDLYRNKNYAWKVSATVRAIMKLEGKIGVKLILIKKQFLYLLNPTQKELMKQV